MSGFGRSFFAPLKAFPSFWTSDSEDETVPSYMTATQKHMAGLSSADASNRYHAAEQLAMLGPQAGEAVPALSRCLQEDNSIYVRKSVAFALGEIGGNASVKALRLAAAEDENVYVRERADQALQKCGAKF